jgi:MFS transporter, MCT family, solute carrier family 16 (monocarboxylic acid transporters), member 10
MLKYLIAHVDFNWAVRVVALTAAVTSGFALTFVRPSPQHIFRKPAQGWLKMSVWIDTHAFCNAAFSWYMVAICAMFFGFYAVFFNLEEVCNYF